MENEFIREGLKARTFADSKISHASIGFHQHILAAWNTVYAGFQRFGRFIQRASSMTCIASCAWLESVVRELCFPMRFGIGKVADGVPNGAPRAGDWLVT